MDTEKQEFKMPGWMEPYREMIGNTGGNKIEDLLNDKDTNSFNNSVRTALIIAVESQVHLLSRLKKKGLLNKPASGAEVKGETDLFQIAFDALRDIDLYSDVADPAATAKQLGSIATSALGKMIDVEEKQYDWTKHGDFCKYYDTTQKRNIWVLGYFGGGAVPLAESFYLARKMAEAIGVPVESIKMDEIMSSRSYKGYKYLWSDVPDQKQEDDVKPDDVMENVHEFLRR